MYEIPPWSPSLMISSPLSQDYAPLWYGFMDESGDPSPFSRQPLVLLAVLTQAPRELELVARRVMKKTGKKARGGELKASNLKTELILEVLKGISRLPISIFVVQVDKSVITRPPKDSEVLYATAVSHLVRTCLDQHPRLEFHFDKRYSNPSRQVWFERWIRDELVDFQGVSLVMIQDDSTSCKALQAADTLAWSYGKNVSGDDLYLEDRV